MMCNTLRLAVLAVGLVSFSALARPSLAVPTVFFDRDNNTALMTSYPLSLAKYNEFTASLTSWGMDDVESAVAPSLSFGATGITAAVQGAFPLDATHSYEIGDRGLVEAEGLGFPPVNTMFTLNQYITSFGLFVIQGGDATNNNPTTFRLRNTSTSLFVDVPIQIGPAWGENNVFFLGVTDTAPFNQVEIIESLEATAMSADATDGMIYDNIVAGGAVPEPGSLILMMLGGACALSRATRFPRG